MEVAEDNVKEDVEEAAVTKTSSSTRRIRASLAVSAAALFLKTVLLYLEIRKYQQSHTNMQKKTCLNIR